MLVVTQAGVQYPLLSEAPLILHKNAVGPGRAVAVEVDGRWRNIHIDLRQLCISLRFGAEQGAELKARILAAVDEPAAPDKVVSFPLLKFAPWAVAAALAVVPS